MNGYTEDEIVTIYRGSNRKKGQIGILAELSLRSESEIIEILKRHELYRERPPEYPKDLTGVRFGRLLVTGRSGSNGKTTRWKCLCDCGNEVEINRSSLIGKYGVKSCGCLRVSKKPDVSDSGEKKKTTQRKRKKKE